MRNMTSSEIHNRIMVEYTNSHPWNWLRIDALGECRRGEWLRWRIMMAGRDNYHAHRLAEIKARRNAL